MGQSSTGGIVQRPWVARPWLAPLIITIAPVILFADRVLVGRSLAVGDGLLYDLPLHAVVARAIRAGQFPGWNPFEFAGEPLMANGQVGVFYPPNLLFLVMGVASATDVVTILSFVIAGLGAYMLGRRWSGSAVGGLVSGLSFGLSGFMVGQVVHPNLIASIAWLPWALLGFDLALERFTIPRIALGSGAIAVALLAGHAQMYLLIMVVISGYGAIHAWFSRHDRPGRVLAITGLVVVIGMCLSAVQLLPIVAVHSQTTRSALNYVSATSYSFSWSHLPLILFPYLFGNDLPTAPFTAAYKGSWFLSELSAYPGLVATVLACAGLGALRKDRRVTALAIVAGGCLLVALGGSTPLSHLVYRLPVANEFRAWGRYAVVLDLSIALLAAKGVAVLRGSDEPAKRGALYRAGACLATVVTLAVVLPHVPAVHQHMVPGRPGQLALLLPVGAAVIGFGVAMLLARRVRWSSALTVLVVAVDMIGTFGAYAEWHALSLPRSFIDRQYSIGASTSFGGLYDPGGGIDRLMYVGITTVPTDDSPDATDAKGIRSTNGYDPLAPNDYLRTVGDMAFIGLVQDADVLWPPKSHVLDLLRVTTILQGPFTRDVTPTDPAILQTGAAPPNHSVVRYYYTPRLPDAFVVGAVRIESRSAIVDALWGKRPFDPAATALVEGPCRGCALGRPGGMGTAQVRWSQNGATVQVQAKHAGMLVLSQSWFPGWHASVDGADAPVVRVDGLVQGVPVPAGVSEVKLSYEPPGLAAGAWLTGATVLGLLGAGMIRKRYTRKRLGTDAGAELRPGGAIAASHPDGLRDSTVESHGIVAGARPLDAREASHASAGQARDAVEFSSDR